MNQRTNGTSPYSYNATATNAVEWPRPISGPGLYGIAGEFVRLVAPRTEADPNAILLTFLVYAGNLIGRNFYIPTGADRHCGNIFVCLVGPTAGGRKGSAMSAAELFFTQGPYAIGLPRVVRGISSGEGVIWKIHDEVIKSQFNKKSEKFEEQVSEKNIEDKRSIYSFSEFAQAITNMKRPDSTLSVVLRQAWDKEILESPSKNASAKATGAHVSLVAGISREELLLETTAVDAQNGTLNRFLFACCKRSQLLPEGESFDQLTESPEWADLQQTFSENIRHAGIDEAGKPLPPQKIKRTAEAQTIWGLNKYPDDGGVYEKHSQLRPGLWGTVTARAPQQIIRLALINAIINGDRQIDNRHQDAAVEYWRYCDESCRYIWGDTTDPTAGRILKAIRDSTGGINRSEIAKQLDKSKDEINTALSWLAKTGLAYPKIIATGGRPAEQWFATL